MLVLVLILSRQVAGLRVSLEFITRKFVFSMAEMANFQVIFATFAIFTTSQNSSQNR
jgi:hypothetical protein